MVSLQVVGYNTSWTEDSWMTLVQLPVRIWYQSFSDPWIIDEAWWCLATEQVNCQLFFMPCHARNTPSSVNKCLHCDASSMSTAQLLPTYPCQNVSQMCESCSFQKHKQSGAQPQESMLFCLDTRLSQSRNCCCHNHTKEESSLRSCPMRVYSFYL